MEPTTFNQAAETPSRVGPAVQQKANANPFVHLNRGLSNLFSLNLGTLLLFVLVCVGAVIASSIIMGLFLGSALATISTDLVTGKFATGIIVPAIVSFALTLLIQIFFVLMGVKLFLSSARGQKTDIGAMGSIAKNRYLLGLGTYAILFLGVIGAIVMLALLSGLLGSASPTVGGLIGILMGIILFVIMLRFSFIDLVMVDDKRPTGIVEVFKSSAAVWKKSALATILLILLLFGFLIVLVIILGATSSNNTPSSVGTLVVIIGEVLAILGMYSALASIYVETVGEGNSNPQQPVAPVAPQAPVAPTQS